MNSRFLMCFAALTLFAATVSLAAQGQRKKHVQYTVTDLGTLGGSFSEPHGINKRDWIVGASTTEGDLELHAFLWRHGMMTDLGTLGGPNSIAGTLAEDAKNGQIPGLAETSTLDPLGEDFCGFGTHLICLAFLWQDGVMHPLPAAGGNNSIGAEVNRRGQVVGTTENNTPDPTCPPPQVLQIVGAIWRNGQIEQQLPPFPGDSAAAAQAINDRGHATGSTGLCFPSRAVLWRDGQVIDLGNLGSTFFNAPFDINNRDEVVGQANLPGDQVQHAFLWTKKTGMQDLGTLPGDPNSSTESINNKGQIAGVSYVAPGNGRAFLWEDGVMTNLNTLACPGSIYLANALDINDEGQIVGDSILSNGDIHAYLATPTDECERKRGSSPHGSEGQPVISPNIQKLLQRRARYAWIATDR